MKMWCFSNQGIHGIRAFQELRQSGRFVISVAFNFFLNRTLVFFVLYLETSGDERGREFGCARER